MTTPRKCLFVVCLATLVIALLSICLVLRLEVSRAIAEVESLNGSVDDRVILFSWTRKRDVRYHGKGADY